MSSQPLLSGEPRVLPSTLDLWCVKVPERERFRCLRHDGVLLGRSRWERSSWTSSMVASWVVFRLKHGGRQCWGSKKSDGIPEHKSQEQVHESYNLETKNLQKLVLTSKVVKPFTRALAPPFIRIRRDFYIPKIPSNLRNIPSVNMDMNVFYIPWFAGLISYIYQATTSSHVQPRLLRQRLWLGFFLISVSLIREDPHTP
jgi:hypothetical protein